MSVTLSSHIPSPHPGLAEPNDLARRLGHAGLIPFVAGTLFIWLLAGKVEPEPFAFVVNALTSYAALVVSFLGGLPWGLTMLAQDYSQPATPLQRRALIWGVVYTSAAWVALLMPPHAGLAALGGLLVGCYLVERKRYPELGAAGWLKLRFRLTLVSSLCCFLAAAQL
ncbi:MAG: DUF3429 domain-containing protein [Burkholderiales bacterium]|nr:DUF3429 domain-containing protein [Burkholderiales bacterium]